MKIENLKVLALKKDDSNVRGHTFNDGKIVGFNEAIEKLGQIEIYADVDSLAKLLFERNQEELYTGEIVTWEEALTYKSFPISEWRNKAEFIISSMPRWIKWE